MSKTVIAQVRRRLALREHLKTFRQLTVQRVCQRFAPLLEDGEDLAGALELLLDVLERCLDADSRSLDRAEERHLDRQFRIDALREERNELAAGLRRELVQIRSFLAGLFGRRNSNLMLGIHGPTAKANDPLVLLRHAHMAAGQLAKPDFVPAGSPEVADAVPLEGLRRSWRESLKRGHDRLQEVCRELGHHTDSRSSLLEKSLKMALHRDDLSAIAHLQQGLLMLGMERDVARKVWQDQRPMGRPARRKAQEGAQAESPAGEQKVSSREVG